MKNLKQLITFRDCMIKLCFITLSKPLLSLNLCLVHLSSGIPYDMADNFSIYLSTLQYERFLVIGFNNKLVKNLSTLHLVVSESGK